MNPWAPKATIPPPPLADVVSVTRVGPDPTTLAYGDGSLWVADDLGVERVDPKSGTVTGSVTAGPVGDVAIDHHGVWITGYGWNRVAEVDPHTLRTVRTIRFDRPTGIAAGAGSVWVVSRPHGTVTRIDPRTGRLGETIVVNRKPPPFYPFDVSPTAIAVAGNSVWVDAGDGSIAKIDASTGHVAGRITVPDGHIVGFDATNSAVWLLASHPWSADQVDPSTDEIQTTTKLHQPALAVTASDAVWVVGINGLLDRLDPKTGEIQERLGATEHLDGVVDVGGRLYVSVHALTAGDYYNAGSEIAVIDPNATPQPHAFPMASPQPAGTLPIDIASNVRYTPPLFCAYNGHDRCSYLLDVYSPRAGHGLPVVVIAHGGPCGYGCRAYLDQQASALALDGAVVFNADYRDDVGSARQESQDLACAVAFAREHAARYGGDPSRVTLVGHSLGSIRGGETAFLGDYKPENCLAHGSGRPDAFVGLGAKPDVPKSYLGKNRDLVARFIIGTRDDLAQRDGMQLLAATMAKDGYDATFTLVPGANHYAAFEVGSGSPAMRMILAVARG